MGSCNVIKSSDVHCSKQQCRRLTSATSTIFSLKIKFLWNILGKTGIETGQLGPEVRTLTTVLCAPPPLVVRHCLSPLFLIQTQNYDFQNFISQYTSSGLPKKWGCWKLGLAPLWTLINQISSVRHRNEIISGKQGENFPPRLVDGRVNDCLWAVIRERSSQPDSKMRHPLTFWQRSAIFLSLKVRFVFLAVFPVSKNGFGQRYFFYPIRVH